MLRHSSIHSLLFLSCLLLTACVAWGDDPVPDISATLTDSLQNDVNGDMMAGPGDTLRYTCNIMNNGGLCGLNAWTSTDRRTGTSFVPGSVTTTQGTVLHGNSPGDEYIDVSLDTLGAGGPTATVTFDVKLDNPLPTGMTTVSYQCGVNGTNFDYVHSDDPDTPASDDPTVTPIGTGTPSLSTGMSDSLTNDLNGDMMAGPGDTLTYTVTLDNDGTAAAQNTQYYDTSNTTTALVPGSVSTSQGTVTMGNNPGDTAVTIDIGDVNDEPTITVTYDATVEDPLPPGTTTVSRQGYFAGDNFDSIVTDDPDTPEAGDPTVTPIADGTGDPQVTAGMSDSLSNDADGDMQVSPGDTLTYTVSLTNPEGGTAESVTYQDTGGTNTTLVPGSVTTSQGTVTEGNDPGDTTVTIDIGDVNDAPEITIEYQSTVDDPFPAGQTSVSRQGTLTGLNFDPVVTDDPDTPALDDPTVTDVDTGTPDPYAALTDSLSNDVNGDMLAGPGDTLTYTLSLSNPGGGTAQSVTYNDLGGTNSALVPGSVTTSQGTVTSGNDPGDDTVTIEIGDVNDAPNISIEYQSTVDDPFPAGQTSTSRQGTLTGLNFEPIVTDDPDTPTLDDPTVTPIVTVAQPQTSATKRWALITDQNDNNAVDENDVVRYTIVVTNNGPGEATNVVFNDTPGIYNHLVPGSVTTTQGTVTLGNGGMDTSVQVNIGTIPEGGSVTITLDTEFHPPGGTPPAEITNQGTVTGDNIEETPTDDPTTPEAPGDTTRTPTGVATLTETSATKRWELVTDLNDNGIVDPGDTIKYTVVIANDGTYDGRNVVFTDTPGIYANLNGGTVTTSQGTVVQGNGPMDGSIEVNVGNIPTGSSATITFEATFQPPGGGGVTQVTNQGSVTGANFETTPTDDPTTQEVGDTTVTPTGDGTTENQPTNVSASDGTFHMTTAITWRPVLGASSYLVYRNTENDFSSAECLGSTPVWFYLDFTADAPTCGHIVCKFCYDYTTYSYWIVAVVDGEEGSPSDPDQGYRGMCPIVELCFPCFEACPDKALDTATYAAQTDSPLALRLRTDFEDGQAIDPGSVWGLVTCASTASNEVEWVPLDGDVPFDGWVVHQPASEWVPGDTVVMTAGAQTVNGEPVGPVIGTFTIESEDMKQARLSVTTEALWQPADLPMTETRQATQQADVTILAADDVQPLANAVSPAYAIGPAQPFGEPLQVWLPMPSGLALEEVALYCLFEGSGSPQGWYLAEQIDGFLVPNSIEEVDIDGVRYIGMAAWHHGVVALADIRPETTEAGVGIAGNLLAPPKPPTDLALLTIAAVILAAAGYLRRRGRQAQLPRHADHVSGSRKEQ